VAVKNLREIPKELKGSLPQQADILQVTSETGGIAPAAPGTAMPPKIDGHDSIAVFG
jgi:hypothetical protein